MTARLIFMITQGVVLALIWATVTLATPRAAVNAGGPLLTGGRMERGLARNLP